MSQQFDQYAEISYRKGTDRPIDPGEQRVAVLALPDLPTDLPDGWPYDVAEQILAIRRAGPPPVVAD